MTDWKSKLATAGLSTTALVACILAGIALAGECNSFRGNRAQTTAPIVAPPTKVEQKAEPKVLPCRDVQAIEPGTRARQKLADKYHRPDLAPATPDANARAFELGITRPPAEILGERQLQPMPAGGTVLATLEPDGRVELTVVAAPEKLWSFRSTYEAGALYGVGTSSGTGDTRGRAWAAVEPVRFARLHLRIEAGADLRAGQTDTYALAGIVWRSR